MSGRRERAHREEKGRENGGGRQTNREISGGESLKKHRRCLSSSPYPVKSG